MNYLHDRIAISGQGKCKAINHNKIVLANNFHKANGLAEEFLGLEIGKGPFRSPEVLNFSQKRNMTIIRKFLKLRKNSENGCKITDFRKFSKI